MGFLTLLSTSWIALLHGALITLQLSIGATLFGALLALPLAIWRVNGNGVVKATIALFVSFLRGTPMIAQLFLVYYGSGQFRAELVELGLWSYFREPMFCSLLTFSLNTAAYQTEILRGGIRGVANGEIQAGRAVGMTSVLLYRRIVLPHAYRIALPALGNEFILMVKGSAIAAVVTILDLMGQARFIFSSTFDFNIFLEAAVLYLIISYVFGRLWRLLEHRLTPQYRHPPASLDLSMVASK